MSLSHSLSSWIKQEFKKLLHTTYILSECLNSKYSKGQRAPSILGNRHKKPTPQSRQVKVQDGPISVASSGLGVWSEAKCTVNNTDASLGLSEAFSPPSADQSRKFSWQPQSKGSNHKWTRFLQCWYIQSLLSPFRHSMNPSGLNDYIIEALSHVCFIYTKGFLASPPSGHKSNKYRLEN